MKTLLLIIAVALYAQPSQAGHCDMGQESGGQQQIMHHQGDGHGMGHDVDHGQEGGHGCCSGDTQQQLGSACDHAIQCGSCVSGAFIVALQLGVSTPPPGGLPLEFPDGELSPSHSVPLLRPPIS